MVGWAIRLSSRFSGRRARSSSCWARSAATHLAEHILRPLPRADAARRRPHRLEGPKAMLTRTRLHRLG